MQLRESTGVDTRSREQMQKIFLSMRSNVEFGQEDPRAILDFRQGVSGSVFLMMQLLGFNLYLSM